MEIINRKEEIKMIFYWIITLMAFGLGIFFVARNYKKVYFSGFQETTGTLVDYKIHSHIDNNTYSKIIEFEVDGQKYRHVQKASSNIISIIGKKIKIRYNPENPTDNVMKHEFTGWVFIIVGIVFIMFGIVMEVDKFSG